MCDHDLPNLSQRSFHFFINSLRFIKHPIYFNHFFFFFQLLPSLTSNVSVKHLKHFRSPFLF